MLMNLATIGKPAMFETVYDLGLLQLKAPFNVISVMN